MTKESIAAFTSLVHLACDIDHFFPVDTDLQESFGERLLAFPLSLESLNIQVCLE